MYLPRFIYEDVFTSFMLTVNSSLINTHQPWYKAISQITRSVHPLLSSQTTKQVLIQEQNSKFDITTNVHINLFPKLNLQLSALLNS